MKLILCPECGDIRNLTFRKRRCACGKSWGRYTTELRAVIGGSSVPLGFVHLSLLKALQSKPSPTKGAEFIAFVMSREAPTIRVDG